jgi:hypothetical protein
MTATDFTSLAGGRSALVLESQDNVAIALSDLPAGAQVTVAGADGRTWVVAVLEDIAFGHKFALADLAQDAPVIKYGEEIGRMSQPVPRGGWIHVHNLYCDRGMK